MKSAIKIAIIYLVFASLWIILSDKLVASISPNLSLATLYSSVKGIAFVVTTGILLFLLILADSKKLNTYIDKLHGENEKKNQLITEMHHRISNNIKAISALLCFDRTKASVDEKNRIISKLISMESVFNILYDNQDIDRLTVTNVFDEYVKLSKRDIAVQHNYLFNAIDVETLASLLLIIDSVVDCLMIDNGIHKVKIEIKSRDSIILSFDLLEKSLPQILGQSQAFIDQYLNRISGTMELQNDYVSRIIILFADKNKNHE
jgi:hypothetical protein